MADKFVIIGGDAAGMSAASKALRENPDLNVLVLEKGEWVSYAACGLPYYIKGEIDSLDDLVARTPEEFKERGIDLRLNHEVTNIDPDAREVTAQGTKGTERLAYNDLLIATGARAVEPPIDGMELEGVFTLRSMGSGRRVRDYVDSGVEGVAIVGGGYVGMEMAEAFRGRGLDVHVFEVLPHVLQPFGEAVAERVEEHLREHDVELHLNEGVEEIVGKERARAVRTEDMEVSADIVLVGAGVQPNTELAEEAGVEVGESGAIATDEYGRTNLPHIYAAGDCAEAQSVVTDEPVYVPLALTANRHGRAIGSTVAGDPTEVGGTAGTAITKIFDLEVSRTGVTDHEEAREAGYDPITETITASNRAHYYPGASPITVSLTADRDNGKLLGTSIVGKTGSGKRVDTAATALHTDMTVQEIVDLDLAYAPPFSPVWDPVLTAAKVMESRLAG